MNASIPAWRESRLQWWACVLLMLAGFLVCAIGALREATYPGWQDTEAYLGHSLYIAENGGFLGFLRDSFAGTFPITERHPLYMLMLAPFASRTADFFLTAKIIDLAFGLVTLVTLVWMVNRRYGRAPALIAGVLYALSSSLLVAASHVNHEMQFVLCTLWTWWLLTEPDLPSAPARKDGPKRHFLIERGESDGSFERVSAKRWALAGIWLGLAYMVKSSALLLAVAVVVAGVWHARLSFFASARFWALLLATVVVASPLLTRNVRGYGELLYEGVNSNIMWLDKWSQLGAEPSIMYYDRYGIVAIDKNGLPTAADYFAKHGPGDIAQRLFGGIATELFSVGPKAMTPALPLPYRVAHRWWGLGIIAFALAGLWLRRRSWEGSLVFFWSAAFITFFGWNFLFPDMRYLASLVPVWLSLAAYAMWQLLARLVQPKLAWRVTIAAAVVMVVGAAAATVARGALTKPYPIMAQSTSYDHLIKWFNATIQPGDRVLLGPTEEFYGLLWMVERPISVIMTPEVDTLDEFLRYLRERKVRYIVMNTENAQGQAGALREALAPYVSVVDGHLVEHQVLPGYRQAFVDPEPRRRFIVYEQADLH